MDQLFKKEFEEKLELLYKLEVSETFGYYYKDIAEEFKLSLEQELLVSKSISEKLQDCRELLDQEYEKVEFLLKELEKTQDLLAVSVVKLVKERHQNYLVMDDGK